MQLLARILVIGLLLSLNSLFAAERELQQFAQIAQHQLRAGMILLLNNPAVSEFQMELKTQLNRRDAVNLNAGNKHLASTSQQQHYLLRVRKLPDHQLYYEIFQHNRLVVNWRQMAG